MTPAQGMPMVPDELLLSKIYLVREKKVMIDNDLALLYGIETKHLKRQVKRNRARFPADFMFQLTRDESSNLRSQFGTSSWGGSRYLPLAFTEQGVAMLSSVLNSEIAIAVNIQIIRLFTKMREMLLTHKDILLQLEKIEKKLVGHDQEILLIFHHLKQLLDPPQTARRKIGFIKQEED